MCRSGGHSGGGFGGGAFGGSGGGDRGEVSGKQCCDFKIRLGT